MGQVIVVGSCNTDFVISAPSFPKPGETLVGHSFKTYRGGKGANQAVSAARAGAEVTLIAKIGKDPFGSEALKAYKKDHIHTHHISIDPKEHTGSAFILVKKESGENTIVITPGANSQLSPDDIVKSEKEIAKAQVLLVQLEVPIPTVHKALQLAKNYQVTTILDPAPAQILDKDLLRLVDYITPNELEIEHLTGISITDGERLNQAAGILLQEVPNVIVTLGKNGAIYFSKKGYQKKFTAPQVHVADSTAAGDTFNGYLAAGLSINQSIEMAIDRAVKAASFSVTRQGAQPSIPFKNQIDY